MHKILMVMVVFILCMSAVPVLAEDPDYRTINGTVWHDKNGDHMQGQDEPALSGWKIHFYRVEFKGNPMFVGEAITDADGYYANNMINPDTQYFVCEVLEPDFAQTYPDVLLPAAGYVDCTQFGSVYAPVGYAVKVKYSQYDGENDFGNRKELPRISGRVFHDANANGVYDGGEDSPAWLVSDWMIYADYNNNGNWNPPDEPVGLSNDQGLYTIFGVEPGNWTIRELLKNSMHCSFPATNDSYGCYYRAVEVHPHGILNGIDFGNWAGANVNGRVVIDLNANHQIDPGELDHGISSWMVYADLDGNGYHNGEPNTSSGTSGEFYLTDLKPGSFFLRVDPEESWECAYPAGCAWNLTQGSGQTAANKYFAFHRPLITLCGYIYEDTDCDGGVEQGPGMGLVPVDLWSTKTACVEYNAGNPAECIRTATVRDAIIATTTTEQGSGRYCFSNSVVMGTRYFLAQNESLFSGDGWTQSYPADPDPSMGWGYSVLLTNPYSQSEGWYFFNYRVFTIPGSSGPPTDPDGDGLQEDLNANGFADWDDAVVLFWNTEWIDANEPVACFDFNHNTFIDWDDAVTLFWEG